MWRFVLRENIRRFEALRDQAPSDDDRARFQQLIDGAQAELDDLEEASTPHLAEHDSALKYFAEHAVERGMTLSGAQFCTLQIYDHRREDMIILAQRNHRAPFLHHLAMMKPGDGSACGRCLETGRPSAIEDVDGDAEFEPHRDKANEAGFGAVHACPIRNGAGQVIAVMSVYFSTPRAFSAEELERMSGFAESIGPALEGRLNSVSA